ncbi:Por secretion system C-terminal sorting domain-containing protein, partial [Maribacter sedimenticola]
SLQLEVTVQPFDCNSAGLQTSYSINGAAAVTAQTQVTITEGDGLDLGILPSSTAFSVSGPNGNDKPLNTDILNIVDAQGADAGTYTFTTTEGCSLQLEVTVQPFDCSTAELELQYKINESEEFINAKSAIVLEGDVLIIKFSQENISFSLSGPNQNSKPNNKTDFQIIGAKIEDEGNYIFTTSNGCVYNFELTVTPNEALANPTLEVIKIYPNPVSDGILYLGLNQFMNQALTANLYDIYGKHIIFKEINSNHESEESLNIPTLSGGIYILEISLSGSDETILKKVIKLD